MSQPPRITPEPPEGPNLLAASIVAFVFSTILFTLWGWEMFHEGRRPIHDPIVAGCVFALGMALLAQHKRLMSLTPAERGAFWLKLEHDRQREVESRVKQMRDHNS